MNKFEQEMANLPDVEPMCIRFHSDFDNPWYHPLINEYYTPDSEMEPFKHDTDLYRIYYQNNKNETMYVYFKSKFLDNLDWDNITPDDANNVAGMLHVALVEDVWCPGGPQFCFTEFGKKVSNFIRTKPQITLFSPDIGMVPYTENNKTEWIFDS